MEDSLLERLKAHTDVTRVKVRFNDTDSMGIVHFKNYLVYFDDGFVSFMNTFLTRKTVEETVQEGVAFGVKQLSIVYHNSARFGDYIIVTSKLKKIGTTSLTFTHNLVKEKDNQLLAEVECVRIAISLKDKSLTSVEKFFQNYS